MNQKSSHGDYDAGCAYQQSGGPEKPVSGQKSNRADNQSGFEQHFAQIKSVRAMLKIRYFRLGLLGFRFGFFLLIAVTVDLLLVFFFDRVRLWRILHRKHAHLINKQLVCVPPDVLCLVISPLVGSLGLRQQLFRVSSMPHQRTGGYKYGQHRHRDRNRSHTRIVCAVLRAFS
jgi:hypothetical protein